MARSKKKKQMYSLQSFVMLTVVIVGLLGIWVAVKLLERDRTRRSGAEALPVACQAYAVQDYGDNDSQFFMLDMRNGGIADFGPLHVGKDYEDLDFDPQTQVLYTATGALSDAPGRLYTLDPVTGFTTLVGDTGLHKGLPSLSFRPTDNTLWGWAEETGLYKIDPRTAKSELVKANKSKSVVGLAWSLDGKTLYFTTTDKDLQKMDFSNNSMTETVIANNFLPDRAEALEMRPDGLLMVAYHEDRDLFIRAYDPIKKSFVKESTFRTVYDDVEGIAWPESCGIPEATPTPFPTPRIQPTVPAVPTPTPNTCPGPITFEYSQSPVREATTVSNQYEASHGVLFRLDAESGLGPKSKYPVVAVVGAPVVAFEPLDTPVAAKAALIGRRFLTDRPANTSTKLYGLIYPIVITFSDPKFMSNQLEFDLIDPEITETYTFTGYQGSKVVFKQEWSSYGSSRGGEVAHVVLRTEKPDQVIDQLRIEAVKVPAYKLGFGIDNINACNWWGK